MPASLSCSSVLQSATTAVRVCTRKGETDRDGVNLLSNSSKLWVGVYDAWDRIVVHMASEASKVLDASNALFLSLVCKHRSPKSVTTCVDRWHVGFEVPVALNPGQQFPVE